MKLEVKLAGDFHPVALIRGAGKTRVRIGDRDLVATLEREEGSRCTLIVNGNRHTVWIANDAENVFVHAFGREWGLELLDPVDRAAEQAHGGENVVRAPMPGMVIEVLVATGDRVHRGQPLLTIESMKLQTVISAGADAKVDEVHVEVGASFDRGTPLVNLARET